MVGLIDTDEHDCATAIGPVLQDDLLLQPVILLDRLVDLVVHVLIVFYGFEVVDVEAGYLFAMGNTADVAVALIHLLADVNPIGPYFIQFLEIRVILVEDAPELEVYQGCPL